MADVIREALLMGNCELLKNIAPCGLVCYTCTACGHGIVRELSKKLNFYLTGVSDFLGEQNSEDREKVETCMRTLDFYSAQSCPGCRGGETQCTLENCIIRECTQLKNIDFCAECGAFPCDKTDYPSAFMNKWIKSNLRIREVGVERFFNEEEKLPHFLRYKQDT